MVETITTKGFGWLKDYPSIRDFTPQSAEVKEIFRSAKLLRAEEQKLPARVDNRKYCSPVRDQGDIGSCTAFSTTAMAEYYHQRVKKTHTPLSPLFLYKVTRKLLGFDGDTGAYMRTAMGALTIFGAPPEKFYPYITAKYEEEPSTFSYAFAQMFQSMKYVRLDPLNSNTQDSLNRMKAYLSKGYASMFGFTVYEGLRQANKPPGHIPFPTRNERVLGGHAILAVGYDDNLVITNERDNSKTTGAILFKNSWGTDWADKGYGWLPYQYFLTGLADDIWMIIQQEWVDSGQFEE